MEFEEHSPAENREVLKEVGLLIRDEKGVNHAVTVYIPEKDFELLKPSDSPVLIIEAQLPKRMNRHLLEKRARRLNKRSGNIIS